MCRVCLLILVDVAFAEFGLVCDSILFAFGDAGLLQFGLVLLLWFWGGVLVCFPGFCSVLWVFGIGLVVMT